MGASLALAAGRTLAYVSLALGLFFFLYAAKYYISIVITFLRGGWGSFTPNNGLMRNGGRRNNNGKNVWRDPNGYEPFVSIHIPMYNEKNVARRIITACMLLDYKNYEVIVVDDSTDETVEILKEVAAIRRRNGPVLKIIHRSNRKGFKGGALNLALKYMNPKTEYVMVFDADFVPPPDIIRQFLWYFMAPEAMETVLQNGGVPKFKNHRLGTAFLNHYMNGNRNGSVVERVKEWLERRRIAAVQGYQLHCLNKSENWITMGVRMEYSGNYMIERTAEEFLGAMKMIAGSVYMIRADVLRRLGWSHNLTEDWELTVRLYLNGYKVVYTPLVQAPAEIPSTIGRLIKQRMRWAEGHTYVVKKYFWRVLRSPNLTWREKLEFLYFAPYYLQSFLFMLGTIFWLSSEFIARMIHLSTPFIPFWTALFGWCLVLSNAMALPLMGLSGLFLERSTLRDLGGLLSFLILSYLIAPYQGYAALKGLLEKEEGTWVRTPKTGKITDLILRTPLRMVFVRRLAPRARRRGGGTVSAALLIAALASMGGMVFATTFATPVSASDPTKLSFEYTSTPVVVNNVTTNRILTHPDYTDLGVIAHIDQAKARHPPTWLTIGEYYLYGPLEESYTFTGDISYVIWMRVVPGKKPHTTSIRFIIYDIDETGGKTQVTTDTFDIELTKNYQRYVFNSSYTGPYTFQENHTIMVKIEIFASSKKYTYYFAYDSEDRHSYVDFPGIVVPENTLIILFLAPVIPILMKKIRERLHHKQTLMSCKKVRDDGH